MPMYEYECEICGSVTSKLFRNSDIPDSLKCGNCGFPAYKILSRFNIGSSIGYDRNSSDIPEDVDEIVELGYCIEDPTTGEMIEGETITIPIRNPEKIRMN